MANATDGRHAALNVRLAGDNEDTFGEVAKMLDGIDDPPLIVIRSPSQAGILNGDNGAAATPDIVIVIFDSDEEGSLSYLQAQTESSPRPVLFGLLNERSSVLMRRALRAGADELLFFPLEKGDFVRALLKLAEARRRAERHQGGVVFSLASVVGGVGVTSLAANLALALHHRLDKRVAMIDLALQSGGLSAYFNLEPDRTILPLARLEKRLDSIQLESALTKHDSGVYLLAAPRRIEDSDIVCDLAVSAVLELMRQLFDFVIIDCGAHVDENAVAAWERSADVLYVLDQSIGAARCAWRFLELFNRLGIRDAELRFVLNRFDPQHPISEKQIAHT
ncbi:MAG: AAA family ATPase, partial [Candidatus Binataceae bacterium]